MQRMEGALFPIQFATLIWNCAVSPTTFVAGWGTRPPRFPGYTFPCYDDFTVSGKRRVVCSKRDTGRTAGLAYDAEGERYNSQGSCGNGIGADLANDENDPIEANFDDDAHHGEGMSLGAVPYSAVRRGLEALYPPTEVEARNAISRSDGYWAYINRGEDPPKHLTYGEFDLGFFAQLLDRARGYFEEPDDDEDYRTDQAGGGSAEDMAGKNWEGRVFTDIGSGAGRLVIAAAALHPGWRLCRGVEILDGIHNLATTNVEKCINNQTATSSSNSKNMSTEEHGNENTTHSTHMLSVLQDRAVLDGTQSNDAPCFLPMAPIELNCGSFDDPYEFFGDSDCVFVFSSCMSETMMKKLGGAIGRQCRPGTVVITTEFPLPLEGAMAPLDDDPNMPSGSFRLELMEKIDGPCELLGGESTAYVQKVVKSLWEKGVGKRERPVLSKEEEAYRLVQLMEAGELTDTERFLRNVHNDMVFHGIPAELRPEID